VATDPVSLDKPDTRVEAERAVRESAARMNQVQRQRGAVARIVGSLAEVRRNNHFAENIKAAMGGDQ
jgi:hypothetical protein